MDSIQIQTIILHHVVAIPHPGQGHINSLLNFCNFLVSKSTKILVTFVVTEEWLGLLQSKITTPDNIRLTSIPNVIPSEKVRATQFDAFFEAAMTKMEAPFEKLLDRLDPPSPTVIIADTLLFWVIDVGCRRNIPVASYWPMSVSFFMDLRCFSLCSVREGDVFADSWQGKSNVIKSSNMMGFFRKAYSLLPKVQYLLISSIYELESQKYDSLIKQFSFPIYIIGPAIPHFKLGHPPSSSSTINSHEGDYFQWLDHQSFNTVLYISLGSLFSVSSSQIDEIAAGLCKSGVRFIWVVRGGGETHRLKEICGDRGLVVPWCDQLRVLCHSSVGGFWSHCGWNSVQEGIFAGVPFLTLPIAVDQPNNSKAIVEDWKVGWSIRAQYKNDDLLTSEEIVELVKKCMDLESDEGKEVRKRAKQVGELCRRSIETSGSSYTNLDSFINDIAQGKQSTKKIKGWKDGRSS